MTTLSDLSDSEDELREYENKNINNKDDLDSAESRDDANNKIDDNVNQNVGVSQPRRTKAPIPRLNTERLKGPKGIHTIEKHFVGFKFYGKGHEKTDLARVMKRLEHWSHRLFPKLDFDDFLEKAEKLGHKKDLSVFITKYRKDMITIDDEAVHQIHDSNDEDAKKDDPIDEFDLLISEQIVKQKQVNTQQNKGNMIPLSNTSNSMQINKNMPGNIINVSLDDEIQKRIEWNKQQAIQRRLNKLKALQDGEKKQ